MPPTIQQSSLFNYLNENQFKLEQKNAYNNTKNLYNQQEQIYQQYIA